MKPGYRADGRVEVMIFRPTIDQSLGEWIRVVEHPGEHDDANPGRALATGANGHTLGISSCYPGVFDNHDMSSEALVNSEVIRMRITSLRPTNSGLPNKPRLNQRNVGPLIA